jgi:DNA primase
VSLIPRSFINELLTRCELVEVVEQRIALRRRGNNYIACCPFHNEKTPSFTVSPGKQFYHCFGCGVNGNAISFLMEYEHLSFVEAIEQLAAQLGMPVPRENGAAPSAQQNVDIYPALTKAANFYQQQLRQHPHAIAYLKQRGLSGQIAKEFSLGYAPSGWDELRKQFAQNTASITQLINAGLIIKKSENNFYDRFRDRIMFPIRDKRGRIIAFGGRVIDGQQEPKYLNSPETALFHKGRELYGLYEACQAQRDLTSLLVVEGYMDVAALAQYGIRNAVATLGTATTADHIQRLFKVAPEIIFCFDGDRAGQVAAWRALETALPLLQDGRQIKFLLLPENEDPDSMVRKENAEQFTARVKNAVSLADFLFAALNKQSNSTSPEGRAHFAKLAVPLLNKLPEGVLQQLLFERLAQRLRMDVGTLKTVTNSRSMPQAASKKKAPLKNSRMRMAMALLLQNPHLSQALPEFEEEIILPGGKVLAEIIALIKQTPQLNTAALLEYWRDRAEYNLLTQLASMENNFSSEELENGFLDVIKNLQQDNREKMAAQLLARFDQLTDAEKNKLYRLTTIDNQVRSN